MSVLVTRRTGLVGMGAAALGACAPGLPASQRVGSAGPAGVSNRRLKIGNSMAVASLDPMVSGIFWVTSYGASESLYRLLPDDKLAPWIASSIDRNNQDGYTVKLDPKAKFHNGRQIDSRTVQGCLERYVDSGVLTAPSLKGARYETPDALTLRINTSDPDPWLPNWLAVGYYPIFDVNEVPPKPDPATLVGKKFMSGQFHVTSLTPSEMTMDAVPEAWAGASRLAGVDVKFIKDPLARLTALKTGEIDMMLYVPTDAIPQIKATSGLSVKMRNTVTPVLLGLNHKRAPMSDVVARRALSLAIDRKQLAEKVLNGIYEPADSFYPRFAPWTITGLVVTDIGEARRLLDAAGWRLGNDGIRVKDGKRLTLDCLHNPQQPDARLIAEALQAQLKAVGFEFKLRQVDDITAAMQTGDYDVAVNFTIGLQQGGNPTRRLNDYYRTTSPRNLGAWGSTELDSVIKKLSVEFDPTGQITLMKQVQEIFRRDVPNIAVVSNQWPVVVNSDFADYVPTHDIDHYIVTKDTAPTAAKK